MNCLLKRQEKLLTDINKANAFMLRAQFQTRRRVRIMKMFILLYQLIVYLPFLDNIFGAFS